MSRYEPKNWVMVRDINGYKPGWEKRELLLDCGRKYRLRYVCTEDWEESKPSIWPEMRPLTGAEWMVELPEWIQKKVPMCYKLSTVPMCRRLTKEYDSLADAINALGMDRPFWKDVWSAAKGEADWPEEPKKERPPNDIIDSIIGHLKEMKS